MEMLPDSLPLMIMQGTPSNIDPSTVSRSRTRRTPRSRFQPQAEAGIRLEPRDEQLLCDLFLNRAMSRSQIQALYFTSLVRCNARLRQLFDHRFVSRSYPPAAPFGAQAIYTVGKVALPLISQRLEMELPEVARHYRRNKTPTFLEHTLAVVDMWVALRKAVAECEQVGIESWVPELLCRHEWEIRAPTNGRWIKEAFKPDAFFRLTQQGKYRSFFVEVDLGHTSSHQFLGKLMTHRRYLESGLFQQTYGDETFKTLVITTGERRLLNLRALVEEQKSQLFWFTRFAHVEQAGFLNPIWQMPFETRTAHLLED